MHIQSKSDKMRKRYGVLPFFMMLMKSCEKTRRWKKNYDFEPWVRFPQLASIHLANLFISNFFHCFLCKACNLLVIKSNPFEIKKILRPKKKLQKERKMNESLTTSYYESSCKNIDFMSKQTKTKKTTKIRSQKNSPRTMNDWCAWHATKRAINQQASTCNSINCQRLEHTWNACVCLFSSL